MSAVVRTLLSAFALAGALHACGWMSSVGWTGIAEARGPTRPDARRAAIAHAQIWAPTDVARIDIKAGPQEPKALPFLATVTCDFLPKQLSGASPKFACAISKEDEVKVKYGGNNAEVYAEVAATRLLWALGFGADRMYPIRVICRGCPQTFGGIARENNESLFDPAIAERKLPGREFSTDGSWSWEELDMVDESAGGAPRAHRDALKLLAVFLQHTDTKAQQQRLLCLDEAPAGAKEGVCERPFMMLNDVGLTFGRANRFNTNGMAMHLVQWSATPVWKNDASCVGNLSKSFTGTLGYPQISEEGRAFLARLLTQLSDQQIRDLFEVSRVTLRLRDPGKARSGFATVEEWVDAFKLKRAQIVDRQCT
jgi:hypothetical protein